jgi:SAM-dependent methyltransferase
VADALFSDPRLAELYDPLDPDRSDLDVYVAMAAEFGARTVVDIGCGTGTLACLLAQRGLAVTGVDPAAASLEVARRKPGADRVSWLHADATAVPPLGADLVTMTGNVAQVFVTDREWAAVLLAVLKALRPGGRLVFESRDPARKAWLAWNRDQTYRRVVVPGAGPIQTWTDLTAAGEGLVSFRSTVVFASDGAVLTSDSTLRFRERAELAGSLASAGLVVDEVRGAPDRPGLEFVFIARKPVLLTQPSGNPSRPGLPSRRTPGPGLIPGPGRTPGGTVQRGAGIVPSAGHRSGRRFSRRS